MADRTLDAAHRVGLIISPQQASSFVDPIQQQPVHREALHTFNPAATVRQGKVYVLDRAEDGHRCDGDQYAAGTTFAECLVIFHGQWLLYYGCADSIVAVAAWPQLTTRR